jgi:F0F1-type ATP synthase assembly protein I
MDFAGIGIQFAMTILVFAFAGVWLDSRLGTSPWLILISVFVGAAGGFLLDVSARYSGSTEVQGRRRPEAIWRRDRAA